MKKWMKRFAFMTSLIAMFWIGTCVADHQKLGEDVVRLHVVGASDSEADQFVKLQVRDAVLECLKEGISEAETMEQVKTYILDHLETIKLAGDQALAEAGFLETCDVSLTKESFPTRVYDTFRLPEGIYESLRVTIGEGKGKNWWCVVFPDLCVGATSEDFKEAAQAGGFPDSLSGALIGEEQYKIRFFFLEMLGKLEKFLHGNQL